MPDNPDSVNRRDFIAKTAAVAGAFGAARELFAKPAKAAAAATGRVVGANDRINVGIIGVGGRGSELARQYFAIGESTNKCKIVAVADVYEKRKRIAAEKYKCDGYLDYREIINRSDVDAVVIATPDHWHAAIALEALDHGKDVYIEKPMCHTIDEARHLSQTVKETKRVLQVGSQTTSALQWHVAKKYIADGAIGKMIMSQGSYHRNSKEGEWNWPIDKDASPDGKGENYIDWKTWLGKAPKRSFDADRFFRFRKYWDYSGGIATDLFFHVVAPLNICWSEPQFPSKVTASGGIYIFKDEREVPDTFHLMAEFPQGHSLVLTSTMANSRHIPGLIRGHEGTIVMVDHGMFERRTDHITLYPEGSVDDDAYKAKFGSDPEIKIPVDSTHNDLVVHITNFLDCMRTREKPTLDVDTGLHAQVTISMAVQSYREGRVLYWDDKNQKVVNKALKA
ncbi:MAG TPA: Gfo/Idh/MocA family oxidoreductase [Bryobacteraceae bacterium]|nr:Gfo/Idh/MocA family oxidoreductase [Bryobacteraceae bacterium]